MRYTLRTYLPFCGRLWPGNQLMVKRSALLPAPDLSRPGQDTHSPRTLTERAYTQLRDDIVEGRLEPGEKLRVEHLRQHYEVSAGILREALNRLVSDALVEAEGQRGFHVTPITPSYSRALT